MFRSFDPDAYQQWSPRQQASPGCSRSSIPSATTPGTISATDYEQYAYDAAGNRLSLKRRDGRTLTFTYDNLNRMLSKLIPDGCPPIQPPGTGCPPASATRDVFYSYDLLGRQLTARFDSTSGADGIANAYDGFGNLTSSQISMAGFTKAVTSLYDLDNNRTRVTHPDAQAFTYAYDARDRLSGVYEGVGTGAPLDTFGWNADDTLASRSENGTGAGSAAYTYDAIGRLATQTDTFPSFVASNVGWTFGVNPASQITSETRDNDAYAFTGIATANKNYSVNGLNQYTAVAGTGHTYDANGNLTGDGTNAYVYDGENRLVSATAAGVTATLTYDPLGRLWQVIKGASDTRFLYDGDALVAEFNAAGGRTARYVHGSNAAADDPLLWYVGSGTGIRRYLHADHLGSIVAATNAANAPTVNTYDEYGVPGAGNVGRFQYTGQVWLSELGLYHYKARLYSPTLGRFLQTDPTGYEGGINLYVYVGDDPNDGIDATGEDCPGATAPGLMVSSDCPNAPHPGSDQSSAHGEMSASQLQRMGQRDAAALTSGARRGMLDAGESLRRRSIDSLIQRYSRAINAEARKYGVSSSMIRAVIREEQSHILPGESLAERAGLGQTVGLGQVTVGHFGLTRHQLLDPTTNIHAIALELRSASQAPLIDSNRPEASIGTRYNCGSCTQITAYGARIERFAEEGNGGGW